MKQCRICNRRLPGNKFRRGTTACLWCVQVHDSLNGTDDMRYATPSRAEFFGIPARQARIAVYTARAEQELPLFDGITTED